MHQELRDLATDNTFEIGDLLRKLDGQPLTVRTAGQTVDDARRSKMNALSSLNAAKQALSMAEAMAAMSMPDSAKNEVARKAHITISTRAEQDVLSRADRAVIAADSDVADAAREHQMQQDIMTSLQKKADVLSADLRFLAPR